MNLLPGPFVPRSSARAMLVPIMRHWRSWIHSPEYRAWLRFNRQLRSTPRRQPGEVRYRGQAIRYLDAPSFLSAWHEIFVAGLYDIASGTDEAGPLLIDAGANIGLAALRWKTRLPRFRYLGFEPDPEAVKICRANLAAWNCGGTVHALALAGSTGQARFLRDGADGGSLAGGSISGTTIEVPTVRLSEYLQEPVALLKIDVEGAEDEVLLEAEPRLSVVRNLFVEVHARRGQPQRWGALLDRLQRAGFRCYVRPLLPPWKPFIEASPAGAVYDEQFNVFAVRPDAGSAGAR